MTPTVNRVSKSWPFPAINSWARKEDRLNKSGFFSPHASEFAKKRKANWKVFDKIDVNGKSESPLFTFLKAEDAHLTGSKATFGLTFRNPKRSVGTLRNFSLIEKGSWWQASVIRGLLFLTPDFPSSVRQVVMPTTSTNSRKRWCQP